MKNKKISERVERIKPSATLRISGIAKELKAKGEDVIDMSVGEPDFNTPENIINAGIKAMKEGKTKYAPTKGVPELIEAIVEKLRKDNGIKAEDENVIVTSGAKYAVYEAMMAILNKGDEVVLLDPSWVSYEACALLADAKPIWVAYYEDFRDAPIEEYISKKTKLIVINSPNNPLGIVYSKEFLKKIRDLALDYDIFVMSDEIYEKIIFEGEHHSIASFDDMFERTITINGFSKTYAMTGWRLGYAVAPEWIIKEMNKIQSHSISSPTTFVQYAGIEALKGDQSFVKRMVSEFKRRRDFLIDEFSEMDLEFAPPEGAFYIFVNVEMNSEKFCQEFLERYHVATTPGTAFGRQFNNWVRVSYATSFENIKEMIERFKKFRKREKNLFRLS